MNPSDLDIHRLHHEIAYTLRPDLRVDAYYEQSDQFGRFLCCGKVFSRGGSLIEDRYAKEAA